MERIDVDVRDLASHLIIPTKVIRSAVLPYPRTVCIHDSCTEPRKNTNGQRQIHYKRHCHEHCYLEGVPENTFPTPQLKQCAALHQTGGEKCSQCGHAWDVHMHITYSQEECTVEMEDKEAREKLKHTGDKIAAIKTNIRNLNTTVEAYSREWRVIKNEAVGGGGILKFWVRGQFFKNSPHPS